MKLTSTPLFKCTATIVLFSFVIFQFTVFAPPNAYGANKDDLKKIEYKYYFRGNYEQAITELRGFLEREDLTEAEVVEAREYLAASLVLTGAAAAAKAEYLTLLKMDGAYAGPDPSVFKASVVDSFEDARSEYASVVIRNAPVTDATASASVADGVSAGSTGKPLYKKWWFYATMGAALLLIAGAASSSGGDEPVAEDKGRVTVGVQIQ